MRRMLLLETVILLSIVILLALLVRRNALKLKEKKGGDIINAKVTKWKAISGRPTRYVLEVEYQVENMKQTKRFITSGKFAKKYEKEKIIPVVVIPNTDTIYLAEEDSKRQNMVLFFLIIIALPFLIIVALSLLLYS